MDRSHSCVKPTSSLVKPQWVSFFIFADTRIPDSA